MNFLEKIREEGKIEEKLEGVLKGKIESKLKTARNMKEFGDSLEKIIFITELSESELRENGIL